MFIWISSLFIVHCSSFIELIREMKRKYKTRATSHESFVGSALILTVVLTSLLAIVGVMFVLVSRLDKMATSGLSENKELNYAVETVIAKISQELASDVPDVNEEYYDYPDANNSWLACLEPYQSGSDYFWRQISDIYNKFSIPSPGLQAAIIPDYQDPVTVGDSNTTIISPADADGDGVSDSVWVRIPHITSSKGKSIYAAVRIVDNGGMLNVNTAYEFDPNNLDPRRVDGSSQLQINLMALAGRDNTHITYPGEKEDRLLDFRCGNESNNLTLYEQNVIWQYYGSIGEYTPFDIGDELVLRNRYILNNDRMTTRIESLWTNAFKGGLEMPLTSPSEINTLPRFWGHRVSYDFSDANIYDYRHISTIYNMDRIIGPDGTKMLNVNDSNEYLLYGAIREGLIRGGVVDPNSLAAQMAVNIKDYVDTDGPNVTVFNGYYGFERPCVYISEVVYNAVTAGDPPVTYKSYAVELHKPYSEDDISVANIWQLVVDGTPIYNIDSWPGGEKDYYVIQNQDPCGFAAFGVDANNAVVENSIFDFNENSDITLQRYVADVTAYIPVDKKQVPDWLVLGDGFRSLQRDINKHKCIKRLWDDSASESGSPTPGSSNSYTDTSNLDRIQAHPYLDPNVYEGKGFKNIGETGMVFVKSAYSEGPNSIGPNDIEATARLDLSKSIYQQIFNYLTVWPPSEYVSDPNEVRVKGRLNINTAPWFVIAQLPWMEPTIAQAIVAYRDHLQLLPGFVDYSLGRARGMWDPCDLSPPISVREEPGFASILELLNITHDLANTGSYNTWFDIRRYGRDSADLSGFPDLTHSDGVEDDIEERDVIFARISNLVTVRSDVFTVYILVRIGEDGPQKRVVAILDRSNAYSPSDKVRIVALHPVPDPR